MTLNTSQRKIVPHIDRNKCEGKGACVDVCPYDVLQLYVLPKSERQALSTVGKIKGFVHGWKQAEIVAADQCEACALCVKACPEKVITLTRVDI